MRHGGWYHNFLKLHHANRFHCSRSRPSSCCGGGQWKGWFRHLRRTKISLQLERRAPVVLTAERVYKELTNQAPFIIQKTTTVVWTWGRDYICADLLIDLNEFQPKPQHNRGPAHYAPDSLNWLLSTSITQWVLEALLLWNWDDDSNVVQGLLLIFGVLWIIRFHPAKKYTWSQEGSHLIITKCVSVQRPILRQIQRFTAISRSVERRKSVCSFGHHVTGFDKKETVKMMMKSTPTDVVVQCISETRSDDWGLLD